MLRGAGGEPRQDTKDAGNRVHACISQVRKCCKVSDASDNENQKLFWAQGGVWKPSDHCWDMINQARVIGLF